MDLIILLILLGLVAVFMKKFKCFVYFVGIIDIFLRIITFVKIQVTSGDIYNILNKYIPASIPDIIGNNCSDILYTILLWAYVSIMVLFEFYVFRMFLKKK
ncbi:MAG TPA: hypothetical protein PLV83_01985 [Bacilli bacterium]|nr:hypothetical protein [Bacilli bacterium]